jgi:hypothetical protein
MMLMATEFGTHGHDEYNSGNDDVQSKHLSAPRVQGVHAHDYVTYIGGEKYNQHRLRKNRPTNNDEVNEDE